MSDTPRVHRSEQTWREIFSRQGSSGVTVEQFCQSEGINLSVYRRWRRALEGSGRPVAPTRAKVKAPAAPPFIDLGELGGKPPRCEVRMELGGGVVLHVVRG